MLRAGANGRDGPLVVCGLSDGNVERLKAGQPIRAALSTFVPGQPGTLVIFHGATEADMERDFHKWGLIGPGTQQSADPRLDQEAEARSRHDKVLIATVGLPRSGKTTWAKRQAWPVVNPDSVRLALHGQRFAERAEPFVWATAKVMVRALFLAGHKHVVLDATNTTRKRRDEWKSPEWGLFFKEIPTARDECLRRAEAENDAEIIPVIGRMAGQFEPLGEGEERWP